MEVTIFAGKGGVGKSTCAAAYALDKIQEKQTLLVDYDGGHSIPRVLGLKRGRDYIPNLLKETRTVPDLHLAVMDKLEFDPIAEKKKEKGDYMRSYLYQFVEDQGFIAFCDMVTEFFGVPTDIGSVSKFISLCEMYHGDIKEKKFDDMIIDVEPTAGLERLLGSTEAVCRSLINMKNTGRAAMFALGLFGWTDIKEFLKSGYIDLAEHYGERIDEFAGKIRKAKYFVICVPESSPVDEMGDVEKVIDTYGGEIVGYIINNVRGEAHEDRQISRVFKKGDAKNVPVLQIPHDQKLCSVDSKERRQALLEVGQNLFSKQSF
ncbi:MAG: P-loop NTPase [Nanoarchaeota archaeon]|nr:P-loop NTPase [Nanoarchaeota archaeon]